MYIMIVLHIILPTAFERQGRMPETKYLFDSCFMYRVEAHVSLKGMFSHMNKLQISHLKKKIRRIFLNYEQVYLHPLMRELGLFECNDYIFTYFMKDNTIMIIDMTYVGSEEPPPGGGSPCNAMASPMLDEIVMAIGTSENRSSNWNCERVTMSNYEFHMDCKEETMRKIMFMILIAVAFLSGIFLSICHAFRRNDCSALSLAKVMCSGKWGVDPKIKFRDLSLFNGRKRNMLLMA